jgi:FkbM family methyltransferase
MIRQIVRKTVRALGYDLRRFTPASDSLLEICHLLRRVATPVIFDVGAHHGQTARAFAKSFPTAALYCFEPFPESFAHLVNNSAHYPAATLEPIGFAEVGGQHEFHINESAPTNSLLELQSGAASTWVNSALSPVTEVVCNFQTLDDYVEEKAIQRIDLLKLDVQGAEHKVLKGAEIALRAKRISHIYMEIIIAETYSGQMRFGDYLNLMDSFGFKLRGLFNLEHGRDRRIVQLDGLFSRDED